MKYLILAFCLTILSNCVFSQRDYWQQEVNFTINVSLNDKEHSLGAFESIEYVNNSPDTLHFIWFHLWPNAYKNDRTAFSEQLLKERRTEFYFSKPENRGYINQLDFKVDGTSAQVINDSNNIDVIRLELPSPLAPGKKVIITTPFKVKLPYNISRGGHVGQDYQVSQWFPKPAVYDQKGWHPMPYLDQGEFFSDFGTYDVEITLPSSYLVAATGVLQDSETLNQLKQQGKHSIEGSQKTWHFRQDHVHDFAWFASKDYVAEFDSVVLESNKVVSLFSFHRPKANGWNESLSYAKDGIKKYSQWLGDYPYSVASIVQGSRNENSGGMEYPTVTLITTLATGRELDATIVHELGHNWFYGALATNEREHPWMDEGMNTFYQRRYEREKYSNSTNKKKNPFADMQAGENEEEVLLETLAALGKDQPIETRSDQFTTLNYGLVAYYKTNRWMKELQANLGKPMFDQAMQAYYNTWKFKHPYPSDFKNTVEQVAGKALDANFSLLQSHGLIKPAANKPLKLSFLFSRYRLVSVAPAVGYNFYDKGMIGGMIHNFMLPIPKFQFLGGALYGSGSKNWNGFGRLSYNIYKKPYQLTTALSYINYAQNDFVTSDNTKLILGITRWVPSVKLTLFDNDALSTRRFTLTWKTFLLNEGNLSFRTINSPTGPVDQVSIVKNKYYVNRFIAGVSDNRVLFPYTLQLSTDQGKDFLRTGLTAKAFFNYADGKSGLSARFFAGKFFYLKPATNLLRFYNDRYSFNMSGTKGKEDYTYSDYFVGRNEFQGWQSQQIMERDGFFKVNTELLGNKVGKTDDWLTSLNLVTDLPDNINPLSILPIKIPLKIFVDAGTYAEAWKNNPASGRFIYDAGIQIPLFHSLVDIYIPLIYSKVYRDYYKTTITQKRFLKTIAFTINISKLHLQEVLKDIPL